MCDRCGCGRIRGGALASGTWCSSMAAGQLSSLLTRRLTLATRIECLLVELKAVQKVIPIHKAQLISYMKLLDVPLGLLMNFHEIKLVDGISRLILPGANGI
jgi:hypothetical protein